jgi:hypothetical protein
MNSPKKYRLLMHGSNFLVELDGSPRKCEFYQSIFIESSNPRQAELLSTSTLLRDRELQALTLNKDNDPPRISMDTYWELDDFDYVGNHLATDRTFHEEKKWWQFWK